MCHWVYDVSVGVFSGVILLVLGSKYLRRRLFPSGMLAASSFASIMFSDETPQGSDGAHLLVFRNMGSQDLLKIRFGMLTFCSQCESAISIVPIAAEELLRFANSGEGKSQEGESLQVNVSKDQIDKFFDHDGLECRLLVSISVRSGDRFTLSFTPDDKGSFSERYLIKQARFLIPRHRKKSSACRWRREGFIKRYGLDLSVG